MSRETDSSSSGPQGRGGAVYPSGTPPYGTRPFPSPRPQEREQERPTGAEGTPGAPGPAEPAAPGAEPAAVQPAAAEPKTETTLTTRIRINIPGSRPIPPVVVRTTVEAPPPPAVDEPTVESSLPAEPAPEPDPPKEKRSDWFAPRKQAPPPQPPEALDPGFAGGGDASGYTGRGTPPGAVGPGAGSSGFTGPGAPSGAGPGPLVDPLGPYAEPDTGSIPVPGPYLAAPTGSPLGGGGARGPHDTPAEGFASPFAGGAEPGTGPGAGASAEARTGQAPFGTEDFPPGVPRPTDPFPGAGEPFPSYQPPAGPTTGPVTGTMRIPQAGPPAAEAPEARHAPQYGPPGEPVSGDTLVSGIPVVPPAESRAAASESAPASAAPKKKGRSKLLLLGVAAGGALVVVYGAGLLMDHADVPKGTTVLGVDIGDKNKDEAVKTLDHALGNRTTAALTLTVDGRKESLKPSVAGLSVDTDATVRAVAHADYNPVSVVGSLFGRTREADPVILVDEDKLRVALQSLAGKNSASGEGMVRFAHGKAVAVPGRPGQRLDVNAAASQVAAAYRTRAATGVDQSIALAVTTVPPKVTQAELTKAVDGFGKTAMSDLVTIRADAIHKISFSPTKSLPKFLTMLPTPEGKLVPHIDLAVLKSLYGNTFNGVLLERGSGKTSEVTPQDVATAMMPALSSAKSADKTVTLPNVAQ